jgi:chemotaxis protein methyltransferase CheR
VADSSCTVTISTFNRDAEMFAFLARFALPELAAHAIGAGDTELKAWSAGCASGEEPYTLVLLWDFLLAERFPTLTLRILGTDIDRHLVERAESACYSSSAVKRLPSEWLARAFDVERGTHCLKPACKNRVPFEWHDLRRGSVNGFDLITCRNVAFTYFELVQQRAAAETLHGSLREGGALVLGRDEKLPPDAHGFSVWSGKHVVYRKSGELE